MSSEPPGTLFVTDRAPGGRRPACPDARFRSTLQAAAAGLPALCVNPLAELFLPLHELPARVAGSEVRRLEHLPDLDLGVLEGGALEPFDRLLLRLHLPQPEPGDELLRLGKRPVDHGLLPFREPDAGALRARLQALTRQHYAGLHQLFVELPHLGEHLLARKVARLRLLVGLHDHHESHVGLLGWQPGFRTVPSGWVPGSTSTSNDDPRDRHAEDFFSRRRSRLGRGIPRPHRRGPKIPDFPALGVASVLPVAQAWTT